MLDWPVFAAILAVGGAAYAVRAGGFVTIGVFPEDGMVACFLRLAPGNLFIAFAAAGCMEGGWPSLAGCAAALAAMAATGREWAGLAAGFAAAAATAVIVG